MNHEKFIKIAFEEAKKGMGNVFPNPLVGAVIVKDNRIISKGYHKKFGEAHAEINALNLARENIDGATLYVNLEPCSHFGKTPPCVQEILNSGIKKVVCSMLDPNPLVNGQGIKILNQNGIETIVGVLKEEATKLNSSFIHYVNKNRPYINVKIAQSIDFKITDSIGIRKQITNDTVKELVYEFRKKSDGILIGANTLRIDDTILSTKNNNHQNKKIIVSNSLNIPNNLSIYNEKHKSNFIFITSETNKGNRKYKKLLESGFSIETIDSNIYGKLVLKKIIDKLVELHLGEILVEGGQDIFTQFINNEFYDEINLFIAPVIYGRGLNSLNNFKKGMAEYEKILKVDSIKNLEGNIHIRFKPI